MVRLFGNCISCIVAFSRLELGNYYGKVNETAPDLHVPHTLGPDSSQKASKIVPRETIGFLA